MADDHYRTLNITPDATPEEIQKSYRALARRYHPDLNPNDCAVGIMSAINAAYEILGEPSKRAEYDRNSGNKHKNPVLNDAVLCAARDALMRQNWSVVENRPNELILKNGSRTAHVAMMRTANSWAVRQLIRRAAGFPIVLAVQAEANLRIPTDAAVIDLMQAKLVHGVFPDSTYRQLFSRFL